MKKLLAKAIKWAAQHPELTDFLKTLISEVVQDALSKKADAKAKK